jgi:hypothetical protein
LPVGIGERRVAGDRRVLGDGRDEVRRIEVAVAVDDEPRDGRVDDGRIEQLAEPQRHRESPGVPRDVTDALGGPQPQVAPARRNAVGCMIDDDCERPSAFRIHGPDWLK